LGVQSSKWNWIWIWFCPYKCEVWVWLNGKITT
jgi:hypothetical protein